MIKTEVVQTGIDISQELALKNYEKVIEYANDAQVKLIRNWQLHDKTMLEHLLLAARNILIFWTDSIVRKRLWVALVRCGAWLGTMETIQKLTYEESMDAWSKKRFLKKISSIKKLPEILQLLEVKGVMTHSELSEELRFSHPSALTETIKKIADLELIDIRKVGKYSLYSLTDLGIRNAKLLRGRGDRQVLLQGIIREYDLQMDETSLDAYLRSADEGMWIKHGQSLKVKMDNEKPQSVKVENTFKTVSYDNEDENCITFKTQKQLERERAAREEDIYSVRSFKGIPIGVVTKYEKEA